MVRRVKPFQVGEFVWIMEGVDLIRLQITKIDPPWVFLKGRDPAYEMSVVHREIKGLLPHLDSRLRKIRDSWGYHAFEYLCPIEHNLATISEMCSWIHKEEA